MLYKLNITRIIASNISMAAGVYFYFSKIALSYLMRFNYKQKEMLYCRTVAVWIYKINVNTYLFSEEFDEKCVSS